jgi:hypothetical protein
MMTPTVTCWSVVSRIPAPPSLVSTHLVVARCHLPKSIRARHQIHVTCMKESPRITVTRVMDLMILDAGDAAEPTA